MIALTVYTEAGPRTVQVTAARGIPATTAHAEAAATSQGRVYGVAGGLCWGLKVAVLAATGTDGGIDVPLFAVGLALLLVGATGLGVWLTRSRPTGVQVAAGIGVAALGLALFVVVQIVTEPLGALLPPQISAEYGTTLAGVVGVVLGLWRLLRPRAGVAPEAV